VIYGEESDLSLEVSAKNFIFFARLLFVLSVCLQLMKSNSFVTKREIYYKNVKLFEAQHNCDEIVNWISFTLRMPRKQLRIVSASKGLVFGAVTMQNQS